MNRPSMEDGHVRMPEDDFEELMELAAERGAKRALANVGLIDEHAANDIRDLRSLLGAFRMTKHTAWSTVIRLITTGLLIALMAGVAIKLKLFGGIQ
jgi:hypothetical protein